MSATAFVNLQVTLTNRNVPIAAKSASPIVYHPAILSDFTCTCRSEIDEQLHIEGTFVM